MGRLGAMLGKLPSLETRSKVRIHQTWWLCASTVPPDPLVVDGVEGGLATKRGVSADGAGVVLGHLTFKSIINCAEFNWEIQQHYLWSLQSTQTQVKNFPPAPQRHTKIQDNSKYRQYDRNTNTSNLLLRVDPDAGAVLPGEANFALQEIIVFQR